MLLAIRRYTKKHKAQSTVEYGILIGVIVAAAVAMQTYIKRSIQGKQKDAADMITNVTGDVDVGGITTTMGATGQYEPYYLARHAQQELTQDDINKNVQAGGASTTTKAQSATARSAVIYKTTAGAD